MAAWPRTGSSGATGAPVVVLINKGVKARKAHSSWAVWPNSLPFGDHLGVWMQLLCSNHTQRDCAVFCSMHRESNGDGLFLQKVKPVFWGFFPCLRSSNLVGNANFPSTYCFCSFFFSDVNQRSNLGSYRGVQDGQQTSRPRPHLQPWVLLLENGAFSKRRYKRWPRQLAEQVRRMSVSVELPSLFPMVRLHTVHTDHLFLSPQTDGTKLWSKDLWEPYAAASARYNPWRYAHNGTSIIYLCHSATVLLLFRVCPASESILPVQPV